MNSEFDNEQSTPLSMEAKTNAQLADELSALELEEKQLDLEIKRETVSKIRAQRSAQREEARAKSLAVRQFIAQRKAQQDNCNHRKGGIGHESVMRGQGTDAMYAVWKHKQPNGTWLVLCSRCGKEWRGEFRVQGRLIEAAVPSQTEFLQAINFPSDNSPSGSSSFQYQLEVEGVA
jgi:hypothetical protein